MFQFDTHIHTSETSKCSQLTAAQLVTLYHRAGYHGFAVTDHLFSPYLDSLGSLPWSQKVDHYLEGYYRAREEGEKIGFKVLQGIELRLDEGIDDYLVYGLNSEELKQLPNLQQMDFQSFRNSIANIPTLVFLAHPYRDMRPLCPNRDIDGVEIFNASPRHQNYNNLAYRYALELGCLKISGSDCHQQIEVGKGGLLLEEPLGDIQDFIQLYRGGGPRKIIGESQLLNNLSTLV